MRCQDIREQLSAYIDGMLDSSLEAQVKLHVASCESCRLEYEDLMTAVQLIKDLPEIAPPPDFNLKLQEKLAHLQSQMKTTGKSGLLNKLIRGKWAGPLAAAAVIFLTVGVTALWYDDHHGNMFNPVVQDNIVDDSGKTRQSGYVKNNPHNLALDSETPSGKLAENTESDNSNKSLQERDVVPSANHTQQQKAGQTTGEQTPGAEARSNPGITAGKGQDQSPVGDVMLKEAPAINDQAQSPGIMALPNMRVAPDIKDGSESKEASEFFLMQAGPMQDEAGAPHLAREYRVTWDPHDGNISTIDDMAVKYDGIIEYEPQEQGQYWVLRLPDSKAASFLNDLDKSGSLEVQIGDRDLSDKYYQIENKILELKIREQELLKGENTTELNTLQQQINEQSQALAELTKETSMSMIILTVK